MRLQGPFLLHSFGSQRYLFGYISALYGTRFLWCSEFMGPFSIYTRMSMTPLYGTLSHPGLRSLSDNVRLVCSTSNDQTESNPYRILIIGM